jgi:hypothetical protein
MMTQPEQQPTRRRARVRGLAGCASLAIAGLTIAACGGGSNTRTVAGLSGHAAQAARQSTPLTVAQSDRDMVEFAQCMRANGVQMSDPQHIPGHSGLSINLPTQDAATAPAYHACTHFIQPIIQAKRGAPALAAPILTALTTYAQCMRAHDINMLDPTPGGQLNLGSVPGITDDFGRYSPQFRHADTACRHLLPPTVHDNGTGP